MTTCKCPFPCNSDNCQACYYDNNTYITNGSNTYDVRLIVKDYEKDNSAKQELNRLSYSITQNQETSSEVSFHLKSKVKENDNECQFKTETALDGGKRFP